jgi:hypothetical protein
MYLVNGLERRLLTVDDKHRSMTIPYTKFELWAHGGCDRSEENIYSPAAPDPTSGVSRGPCKKPDFHCMDFYMYLIWALILTADFSVYLPGLTDCDGRWFRSPYLDTPNLITDI